MLSCKTVHYFVPNTQKICKKTKRFAWSWIKILFDHRWFSATWSCIIAHYICSKFTKDHTIHMRKILKWYWIKISFDHSWISSTWSCKIVHYYLFQIQWRFSKKQWKILLKIFARVVCFCSYANKPPERSHVMYFKLTICFTLMSSPRLFKPLGLTICFTVVSTCRKKGINFGCGEYM